ncbi:hypothetical protein BA011_10045 [Rhizobium leguminosarum]|uniref:Uncharacterized protein n=2 Tax=Rhizobium leguminosarum TaxID=384 RepID=A0A1B1C8C9_RHILE|nr:hypothetical protein BA011_10045 [Rhizobium leguminosarum]
MIAGFLTVFGGTGVYANCTNSTAIWSNEGQGVRHIVYGTDGINYGSNIYFEEWRGSQLAWRARGSVTCSNGASTCYGMVRNASGLTGDDETTDVVLETIDADSDGLADWVIFAGLGQKLYYTNGADVNWFNGFQPGNQERVLLPNIYKFLSCRKDKAVQEADTMVEVPEVEIVGAMYAIPAFCARYKTSGSLTPNDLTQDGVWYLDNTKYVGSEFGCKIVSKTETQLNLSCEGEGEHYDTSQNYSMDGLIMRVGDVNLYPCKR